MIPLLLNAGKHSKGIPTVEVPALSSMVPVERIGRTVFSLSHVVDHTNSAQVHAFVADQTSQVSIPTTEAGNYGQDPARVLLEPLTYRDGVKCIRSCVPRFGAGLSNLGPKKCQGGSGVLRLLDRKTSTDLYFWLVVLTRSSYIKAKRRTLPLLPCSTRTPRLPARIPRATRTWADVLPSTPP